MYQAVTRQGPHKAVRCFQRPTIDLADRYEQISAYLSSLSINKPSSLVGFKYIENSIRFKQRKFYPIVKMDWVDGDPLNVFIKKHIRDKKILQDLTNKFVIVVNQLRSVYCSRLTKGAVIGVACLYDVKKYTNKEDFLADKVAHLSDNFSNPEYGFLLKDAKKLNKPILLLKDSLTCIHLVWE